MDRITFALAALLALAAASAGAQHPAQAPEVPKQKCEKPQQPMRAMMQDANTRKKFQREIDTYKACMKAYADDRAAAAKAHTDAGNAAITEYNETIKALQDAESQR